MIYPQEMLPAQFALPYSHNKLPEGAKPDENLPILLPVAPDQAPLPGTGLRKPSPAAWLMAKHLLHRWWRQSRLLRQAQLCPSARAAATQRGKQLYFNKKLSKAPSASVRGQDSSSEPGPQTPAIPARSPPRPGALCVSHYSQRDTSTYRHKRTTPSSGHGQAPSNTALGIRLP